MCKRKGWEEVNEVSVFGGCDGKRKKRERKRKASPPLQQAREECHSPEQKPQGSQQRAWAGDGQRHRVGPGEEAGPGGVLGALV